MIITARKALVIVSSHDVIKAGVVKLLPAVEAYAERRRKWTPKKNCNGCDEASFFKDLEDASLQAIQTLDSESIGKLKKFLNAKDLWINTSEPGKPSQLKALN